jgi:hypothetical protein
VPNTALKHFTEDISRARAILKHADPLPEGTKAEKLLRTDLLRSAWMFAVGALDAYFCDAYTDVIAATISSKSRQPTLTLPEFVYDIKFPISVILEDYDKANWRWRMAARKMMERENVLSLGTIQTLFNKFFREDRRFFGGVLHNWIQHAEARKRLFRVSGTDYSAMTPKDQDSARKSAKEKLEIRFKEIFQRRHDCIHNCDRPRVSPQLISTARIVLKVIEDVEFLVNRCNEHINTEFRQFLVDVGCSTATIAVAGY